MSTHQIAGLTFRTESDVLMPHLCQEPFLSFQIADREPDVHYRISQFDPDVLSMPPLDDGERARIVRCVEFADHWLESPLLRSPQIRTSIRACLSQPEMAHIGLRWNRAIIRNFAQNKLDFFYPPAERKSFAEPLMLARYRNMLTNFLPGFSAVMVHSAGVITRDAAALFLAPDEGGKTTVVKQANGLPILSDDNVVLHQEDDVVMAHGTPFGPLTSGPQQARLGGIFLLEKSPYFELLPIRGSEALRFIWDEHLHVWVVLPKSLRLRAFDLLYNACHQATVYRMRFPKDHVDWEAIDAVMAG